MTDEASSPHNEEVKKLHKRERLILERLREAEQARGKALERFARAEKRLQKRAARVQRFEDRLAFIRQQLEATKISSTSYQEIEQFVSEARAAANAAEEQTRLAAERAAQITQREDISRIEEEEELVSAVTAETIASVAAGRAAEAEMLAEISSAQALEARQLAREADQALAQVRRAIREGNLSGAEAETALRQAEAGVTRAQAALADAEAISEQAIKAALNAEAEAEVAEGMAYAADEHIELLAEAIGDDDSTAKIPKIRPGEEK